jgi:dienelactone hydrolase
MRQIRRASTAKPYRRTVKVAAAAVGALAGIALLVGPGALAGTTPTAVPAGVGGGPPTSGDTCAQAPGDPAPGSQAWEQRDLQNIGCATQRQQDELSNPAFLRMWAIENGEKDPGTDLSGVLNQLEHPTRPTLSPDGYVPFTDVSDPFRDPVQWQQDGRGQQMLLKLDATTGAHLNARLYWPNGPGPYPGVVMVPGLQAYNEIYEWLGEGLAENGYMVLIPDPQGQGDSETLPHNPDGSIDCSASGCPNTPTDDFPEVPSGLDFLLSTPARPDPDAKGANAEGTLTYNPEWRLLDPSKVGVAGHSLGAIAVTSAGQDDPRVDAVVAFDNLDGNITLAKGARIHAPALYFGVDYAFPSLLLPQNPQSPPDPSQHEAHAYAQTVSAGVDSMVVVPRASTHYEFSYQPFPGSLQASRYGERVAFYYTLAWFDRYLKGEPGALERLTATRFDGSADTSSIGAGTFDPSAAAADPADPAAGNVPYKIGAMCVSDLLSFYYRSGYWLDHGSTSSDDLQARGCPA